MNNTATAALATVNAADVATRAAIAATLPDVFTAAEKDAAAAVLATAAEGFRALDDKGRPVKLTPSEIKVLVLVSRGLSSQETANVLFISKRTVDFHLFNVFAKLGTNNRTAALAHATALGLVK